MKRTVLLVSVAVLFVLAGNLAAQDQDVAKSRLEQEQAEVERGVNQDASLAAHKTTFKGRIPDGFGKLNIAAKDLKQVREQVYKIQEEYHAVIESLRARIVALEKERDAKVDGVLTDDQRVALKKFRDDAATRRRATGARATNAADTAEEK